MPVKFVLKDFVTSVAENIPAGSIILRTGVNKIDPVSQHPFKEKLKNFIIFLNSNFYLFFSFRN